MLRHMLEMYIWFTLAFPPIYIKFILEVTGMWFVTRVAMLAVIEAEEFADTRRPP